MTNEKSESKIAWWHCHRRLYNWVVHWADTRFGFLALIVLAITEPIFVPVPADVLVIGMCLGRPKSSLKYGLTCAFFSVLGGTIAFSLGLAIGGENVVGAFEQLSFGPIHLGEKTQQALELYQKYDFWAIAISALTPVPYMLFSWVGGMAEVSLVKFIGISIIVCDISTVQFRVNYRCGAVNETPVRQGKVPRINHQHFSACGYSFHRGGGIFQTVPLRPRPV